MMPIFIVTGLVIIAGVVLFVMWRMMRSRKLPASLRAKYERDFATARSQNDAHRKILDAENVVDHALRSLGYQGSFADKLKKAGPRFSDVQALWNAHKLRNRIAHESGVQVSVQEADRVVSAFERALKDLL